MLDEETLQMIQTMQAQIADLTQRLNARDHQQLVAPVDDVTKAVIGAALGNGPGSSSLTQIIGTAGPTATVPAAYQGSRIILLDDSQYEVPYIAKV